MSASAVKGRRRPRRTRTRAPTWLGFAWLSASHGGVVPGTRGDTQVVDVVATRKGRPRPAHPHTSPASLAAHSRPLRALLPRWPPPCSTPLSSPLTVAGTRGGRGGGDRARPGAPPEFMNEGTVLAGGEVVRRQTRGRAAASGVHGKQGGRRCGRPAGGGRERLEEVTAWGRARGQRRMGMERLDKQKLKRRNYC